MDSSEKIQKYYKFHSRIYDITRWTFLFGRSKIIDLIPDLTGNIQILEIGCGTGRNLALLQKRFPDAHITGIDLSAEMIAIAEKKFQNQDNIRLINTVFPIENSEIKYDLVLVSYCLSMTGDFHKHIIHDIAKCITPKSFIAVVDFHHTGIESYRQFMKSKQVYLEKQLIPELENSFTPLICKIKNAYFGIWSYFYFIGKL